jgi:flagellum-specific peptidoglycan hydrolase FlgJ
MIGSLMSRMGSAQKLSIPQLQQAIKDGTLPAYIGIPLLQDKMREQKGSQAQQPQQPPIAQQVMQEAQGIDSAPSNLPQEMAGGGIIAFAGGDLVDEDEDQNEEAEYQQALNTVQRLNETPRQNAVSPETKQENKPEGIRQIGKQGKEFYEERYNSLLEKAKEMGFKHPEVIAKLGASQAAIETGFGKSAPNHNYYGIKGAGSQQTTQEYIPGKGMVTIKDSFRGYSDPSSSDADYLRLMQNPRYRAVAESQDPYQAAQAVKQAGYATAPNYTEALSSILASMGKKASDGGIMRLAAGGGIDDEGNPLPKEYSKEEAETLLNKTKPTILTGNEPISIAGKSFSKPAPKAPVKTTEPAKEPAKEAETETPMMANQFDDFLSNYKQEREAIKQAKEEDKYMALLSAGLGMMGGTSPYALSNIGKGAMAGVQEYGDLAKQRAAEKAALDRNYVTGQRYKQLGDIALMGANMTNEQKAAILQQRKEEAEDKRTSRQQAADLALSKLDLDKAQIDALKAQKDTDRQKSYAQLYIDAQQKYQNELEKAYPERRFIPKQQELYDTALKQRLKELDPLRQLGGIPALSDFSANSDVINRANAILGKK